MDNEELSVAEELLVVGRWRWAMGILNRCRVLVVDTANIVVIGVIGDVEAAIFAPSAEHD